MRLVTNWSDTGLWVGIISAVLSSIGIIIAIISNTKSNKNSKKIEGKLDTQISKNQDFLQALTFELIKNPIVAKTIEDQKESVLIDETLRKLNEPDIKVIAVHAKYPDIADKYDKGVVYCDGHGELYPQGYKDILSIQQEQYWKVTEKLRQLSILDYLINPNNSWELIQKVTDFGFKVQQKLKDISRWIDVD